MVKKKTTTKKKSSITAAQKTARRKNVALARAARKPGKPSTPKGGKAGVAAKSAYKKTYKEVRGFGGSKENARTMALQAAHKKGAKWTYKKARTLAVGIGRKYGWSKSGVDQFARGFTKALRRNSK